MNFILWFLAPAVTLSLTFLKIPDLSATIISKYPGLKSFLEYFSLLGTSFIYYFSIFSPYKLFQKTQKQKYQTIDLLFKNLNEDYDNKFKFSYNIMFLKKSFLFKIEPVQNDKAKAKFSWWGNVFKVVHDSGTDGVHPKFKITENQGVCGTALKNAKSTHADYVIGHVLSAALNPNQNDYNLTNEQKEMTKDLILVVSCPLIIKEKDGDNQKPIKLGVLNVESKIEGSAALFTDAGLKDELLKKIANLGKVFITLHV